MLDTKSMFPDPPAPVAVQFTRIRVVRHFMLAGVRVCAGSVLDVPADLAQNLTRDGKAEAAPSADLCEVGEVEVTAAKLSARADRERGQAEAATARQPAK